MMKRKVFVVIIVLMILTVTMGAYQIHRILFLVPCE